MKHLISVLSCLFLSGCGVLEFPLEKVIPQEAVITYNPPDANRLTLKNNTQIGIKSYANNSITGSGIFHQANLIGPTVGTLTLIPSGIAYRNDNNHALVSYSHGSAVVGAVDVLDLSNKLNPVLLYSYSSENYRILDVKVKGDNAYLALENASQTFLYVLDISVPTDPKGIAKITLSGQKFKNLDLEDNALLAVTDTTLSRFDVTNSANPVLVTQKSLSKISYGVVSVLYDTVIHSLNNTALSTVLLSSSTPRSTVIASAESSLPARLFRQNSLVYSNDYQSNGLNVVDVSQSIKNRPVENIASLALAGTGLGLTLDQQKVYLAQGSEGFVVANAFAPLSPAINGLLVFTDSTAQALNAWSTSRSNFKYLFLNDSALGLRILTEDYAFAGSDQIQIVARGENNSQNAAKLLVRVNGVDEDTLTLSNTAYQTFNLTYSRVLNSLDKVEVLLLNPANNQSGFVSFVKVNGFYCYQKSQNNVDDSGLFTHLQTIEAGQNYCSSFISSQNCFPGTLQIPNQSCNLSNNRTGKMACDVNGLDYECKDDGGCQAGYSNIGGSCVPQTCSPNTVIDCSDSVSTRQKTCNSSGTGYGACELVSCNSGYALVTGQCQPMICTPNSTASCSVTNGMGSKTCAADGSTYGSCSTVSCNSGYYLNNGNCIAQTCSPNSTQGCVLNHLAGTQTCNAQGSAYGSCVIGNTCEPGYYYFSGMCLTQTCSPGSSQSCAIANGSGTQICNSDGSAYGSCTANSCNSGYFLNGNICTTQSCTPSSTQACVNNHLVGTQTCNVQGSGYQPCVTGSTCEAGYYFDGSVCQAQICTPNSSASCSANNGSGTKTCNVQGSAYGSCAINACDAGYFLNAGSCSPQTCTPNSTQSCVDGNHFVGTQTCAANGSAFGSCNPSSTCEAGYTNVAGTCTPQSCTPNSTSACSAGNGSGTYTCNAGGTGYGSCVLNACDSGFYLNGGVCIAQTCTPNSTTACSGNNGTGLKTCDAQGSSYGSCVVNACNSGYYLNAGTCTPQLCTPTAAQPCITNHFNGFETCNAQGSAYGACTSVGTCESGYYLNAGSCVPQTCSPNSTTSCAISNGSGTKTCASDGSAYGSCQIASCNAGFYNNGSSCVAQTCTPTAVESCTVNHFTGTHTCNAAGSGYSICITGTSCEAGYYNNGSACVPQVCTPNATTSCSVTNGSGTHTCDGQGSGYGTCTPSSCDSGFVLSGGVCVAQICTPNATVSCSVTNGSGTKTCNGTGTSYGSCTANSCNTGFYLDGSGVCLVQACIPNSTSSCSVNHFAGTKTCNAQGSNFGSCNPSGSCEAGYYLNGGSCLPQSCTPNSTQSCSVTNGTGIQTCASDGSAYGSCNLTTCNAGYYNNNGTCTPQACTPNSTASCTVTNGSGLKSCVADGSGYGSCSPTTCNSGFHVQSGSCQPNVISCPIANGTGTQTWNGSSYGTCTVTSCISDAYQSGNTCVLYCPNPLLIHAIVLGLHVCL